MTYSTFDPSHKSASITLSGGNLVATTTASGAEQIAESTLFKSTGQWYCEITLTTVGANFGAVGIGNSSLSVNAGLGADANGYGWLFRSASPLSYHSGATSAYGAQCSTPGDIISILFDADAGTLVFWKNGVSQGTAFTGITGSWAPAIYGTAYAWAYTANFGASAFSYSPPVGYLGWSDAPIGIVNASAPKPTLVTGFDGAVLTAPKSPLITGFNGAVLTAPKPALVVAIPIYGILGTAPKPTVVITSEVGAAVLAVLTAPTPVISGAITPSATIIVNKSVPVPRASGSIFSGEVTTFAGTAPAPTLESHTKDARLTAPVPTLVATIATGTIITVAARAVAPILVATLQNPAIITTDLIGLSPRLSATFAAGNLATAILTVRAPILSSTVFTGNVVTVFAEAATPIMAATGYPAYTITFAGTAPASHLNATLSANIASAYRTFALNTRKLALSEYGPEWAMNSYCIFQGKVLGCTSSGVVELGMQALDNATTISSTVKSGADNFGMSVIKRLPRIYLNYTTGGDAQFKLITTEGGSRTYALNWNNVTGTQTRRIPVGKGPKSARWQWEYTNVDGADFDIDAVLAYPQALRRRVQ